MTWRQWTRTLHGLLRPGRRSGQSAFAHKRVQVTHVLVLDGTMSSLDAGCESNAGLTYRLLAEQAGTHLSVYYEAGLQWHDWRTLPDVLMGRGLNRQIRRAYGYLASRYRPGDRIFLFGYSRGAYAVRSLAGMIDRIGLLRAEAATERHVRTVYRLYRCHPHGTAGAAFRQAYCHDSVEIEMVGVWDTVKALGLHLPLLRHLRADPNAFHNHDPGPAIRHGYHALALDETRRAYAPVLWDCPPDFDGALEQVWFRGSHGDVGGQVHDFPPARPLANIALVWMLQRAARCGLPLRDGWRARFATDAAAPSSGTWRGWGKVMWRREPRLVGRDSTEHLHHSVPRRSGLPDLPLAQSLPPRPL